MNSIANDANRLAATSIWRSFQASDKQHLVITGNRKSGKTTLLNQLLSLISEDQIPGITTYAQPKEAIYMRTDRNCEPVRIGIYDPSLPGKENKMRPIVDNFLTYGLEALTYLKQCTQEFVFIDEIGYLETVCEEYCEHLTALFDTRRVLCVVRKQKLPFLTELQNRKDVFLVDLDQPFGTIGCVIMASGFGRRFGSNKLLESFHGKPMIEQIFHSTTGIFSDRVVVTRYEEIKDLCSTSGIDAVVHDLPYRNDTIRLGLEHLNPHIERCMFCPSDQPLLSRETLQTMALYAVNYPDKILRLSFDSKAGAPVIFPKKYFDQLKQLPPKAGGNAIMKKYPQEVVSFCAKSAEELMDVDTTEDLIKLSTLEL